MAMGEQTRPQTQTQTLAQIQSQPHHSLSQSQPQSSHDTINNPAAIAEATAAEVSSMAASASASASQNNSSSSSSKIPFRPRKIRKTSSDVSPDDSDKKSSEALDGDSKAVIATNPSSSIANTNNKKSKIVVQSIRALPRIIARTLSCEGEIEVALRHLRNSDPLLARVIDVHQRPIFDHFHPPFLALAKSILYQQLAFKAGTSIYTRFVSLCGGEACVVPEIVLGLTPNMLRQIGVSGRKASYLHDLSNKYRNGILSDASIVDMDDKSLFTMLTMVNGIGAWSVHMFMIFSLHRPDVLPVGDLGVRKGVQHLYGLEQLPRPSQMEQLCEKWRPYRSVGSWYMWRLSEAKRAQAMAANASQQQEQLQQQQQQQQLQQQMHQQLLHPINSITGLGACTWSQ